MWKLMQNIIICTNTRNRLNEIMLAIVLMSYRHKKKHLRIQTNSLQIFALSSWQVLSISSLMAFTAFIDRKPLALASNWSYSVIFNEEILDHKWYGWNYLTDGYLRNWDLGWFMAMCSHNWFLQVWCVSASNAGTDHAEIQYFQETYKCWKENNLHLVMIVKNLKNGILI